MLIQTLLEIHLNFFKWNLNEKLGIQGFYLTNNQGFGCPVFPLFLLSPQPVKMVDWSPIPVALLAPSSATKAAADPATKAAAIRPPTHLIPPWIPTFPHSPLAAITAGLCPPNGFQNFWPIKLSLTHSHKVWPLPKIQPTIFFFLFLGLVLVEKMGEGKFCHSFGTFPNFFELKSAPPLALFIADFELSKLLKSP